MCRLLKLIAGVVISMYVGCLMKDWGLCELLPSDPSRLTLPEIKLPDWPFPAWIDSRETRKFSSGPPKAVMTPAPIADSPSDELIKEAIASYRRPLPTPEYGYELDGDSYNGTVEILRQSEFDGREVRVAASVTADIYQRATQAPSPFDKPQTLHCKYHLVEYYRVERNASGRWTAYLYDRNEREPQMQCR